MKLPLMKTPLICALFLVVLISSTNGNVEEAVSKRSVPTINTIEDLDKYFSSYLDRNKKIAALLDFDGTLAEITDRPEDTEMTKDVADVLHRVAKNSHVFLGMISGRGLSDIKNKIKIQNITYSGNHGFEIENPDGSRSDFELPQNLKDSYTLILKELNEKVVKHKAWIEDKKISLTIHYAETPEKFVESLRNEAIEIIQKHGWLAADAHLALDAKPPVNWNKGEAANLILRNNFGVNWANDIKVIYIGDDTSDEDVMKVLQGKGRTFRINKDPNFETYSDFRLPTCSKTPMVLEFIDNFYA